MIFNMVESKKIETRRLGQNTTDSEESVSITLELERFELQRYFFELDDKTKIRTFMSSAKDKILWWFKRKKHFQEVTEKTTWSEFKNLLLQRFGISDLRNVVEWSKIRKTEEQSMRDYIEEMGNIGIELDLSKDVLKEIIRQNIKDYSYEWGSSMISRPNLDLTLDRDLKTIKELESIIKIKEQPRKKTKAKMHHENNNIDTAIKTLRDHEKAILINGCLYDVIFDTGAHNNFVTGAHNNFVTEEVVSKTRSKRIETEPKCFRTCLGESFKITSIVNLVFSFKGKEFLEKFYVLPKRKGLAILIGEQWISNYQLIEKKKRQNSEID